MLELSKEKANANLLDRQLNQFQTSINRVENELSGQIRYLTQVCVSLHVAIHDVISVSEKIYTKKEHLHLVSEISYF